VIDVTHPCFSCRLADCDDASDRCGLRRAMRQYQYLFDGKNPFQMPFAPLSASPKRSCLATCASVNRAGTGFPTQPKRTAMSNEIREYYGKANPMIPTGRTRRRFFGTQYEYEGPVRQDKSHNLFNIDQWPRGLRWSYRKPERMPFPKAN